MPEAANGFQPPRTHHRRSTNRRMDSDAQQRNPSDDRKINTQPAPDSQNAMSEAASGFQPPRTHRRRIAHRRMDTGAKQRNPSDDRKINTKPTPDSQIAMSEAASGFQPPRTHRTRTANRRMDSGAQQRNPSGDRKINTQTHARQSDRHVGSRKRIPTSKNHIGAEPHTGGWIATRSNAIRRAIARSTPSPRQTFRPPRRKPQADSNLHQPHHRKTANRRMDSDAKQRNPSSDRKINTQPAPDIQTATPEAASGFQPPSATPPKNRQPEDG